MTATDTEKGLLRKILDVPFDNTPRLVYADYLDENGQEERAEFIRVQCDILQLYEIECKCTFSPNNRSSTCDRCKEAHKLEKRQDRLLAQNKPDWFTNYYQYVTVLKPVTQEQRTGTTFLVVRNGFISEVYCTLETFVGGECQRCYGLGVTNADGIAELTCMQCNGFKETVGIAADLFAEQPITKVVITNTVIHQSGGNDTYYISGLGIFPKEYWSRLDRHRSRIDAQKALEQVCIDYGRSVANIYMKLKRVRLVPVKDVAVTVGIWIRHKDATGADRLRYGSDYLVSFPPEGNV